MNEKLEFKGYWWLPTNPNNKVAVILTYIPNHSIMLELIGAFASYKPAIVSILDMKPEDIIYGISSESKNITLISCYSSGSVNLSCSFPIIKYGCQLLIIGKHLKDLNEKCFHKAIILIPQLSFWCSPSALRNEVQLNNEERIASISISFNSIGKIFNKVDIDDDTQLIINEGISYRGEHLTPFIEQYTYLEILKNNNSSFYDFNYIINLYEQFISLATLQTSKCSQITLYDKSIYQVVKDEKKFHAINVVYIQRDFKENHKIQQHKFLFDYHSISADYPEIVKKWYNDSVNIAPIRAHLIDSIKEKSTFSSIDFLIIIQAIEGFCTRFRKAGTLKQMLEMIIDEFRNIDKLKDDSIKIKEVVDSRHYYSHFMEKSKKPNTLEGIDLYNLTFKLRKLLVCCLLKYIGFDNEKINIILNKSNSNLLNN